MERKKTFCEKTRSWLSRPPPKTVFGMTWDVAITIFIALALTVAAFFLVVLFNQTKSIQKVNENMKRIHKENKIQYSKLANKLKSIEDDMSNWEKQLEEKNFTLDEPPKVNPFKGKECYYKKFPDLYQGTKTSTKEGDTCLPWATHGAISKQPTHRADAMFPPFPDGGSVKEAGNYCRRPVWDIYKKYEPWCYTNTKKGWGLCGVPKCNDTPPDPDISLTKRQQETILMAHNVLRQSEPAANLMPLVWDQRLQENSRLGSIISCHCCKMTHTPQSHRGRSVGLPWAYAGENAMGYPGNMYRAEIPLVWDMIGEKERYCLINNTNLVAGTKSEIGHYTQMVESWVTNIGCGRAYCGPKNCHTTTLCQYGGYGFWKDHGRPYRMKLDSSIRYKEYPQNLDIDIPNQYNIRGLYQYSFCIWPKRTDRHSKDQAPQQLQPSKTIFTCALAFTVLMARII